MKTSVEGNPLYPIFLKLNTFKTLVVGGGNVGLEKLESILKNDPRANIRLVAPWIKPEIIELSAEHEIMLIEREFRPEDLEGWRASSASHRFAGLA